MSFHPICYYCSKISGDPKFTYPARFYKQFDSELGIDLTGLKRIKHYYQKTLPMPRCEKCATEHGRSKVPALLAGLVVAIIAGFLTVWYLDWPWYGFIPAAILAGIIGLAGHIELFYRRKIKALDIKDENDLDAHPPAKALLDDGWSIIEPHGNKQSNS